MMIENDTIAKKIGGERTKYLDSDFDSESIDNVEVFLRNDQNSHGIVYVLCYAEQIFIMFDLYTGEEINVIAYKNYVN